MQLWVRCVFAEMCLLVLNLQCINGFFGLTAREPVLTLTANFEDKLRALQLNKQLTTLDLCNMLSLQKQQRRQCRGAKGVSEALVRASRLSALECLHQFQHERWNCSLGEYRKNILTRGFKETAFLFAISSAGLVHEIARACAEGLIPKCTCDESKDLDNAETWRWGGCGDNIRFGSRFTHKFLQLTKRSEMDIKAKVDTHNSHVGIRVVKDLLNTKCKCHGVSGSCTVETCWLQLSPFKTVSNVLKQKYEASVQLLSFPNQAASGTVHLMQRPGNLRDISSLQGTHLVALNRAELMYTDTSPNFCLNSSFSPGTSRRTCVKGDNCDSLCCDRGYNVQRRALKRSCRCETIWCCRIQCKVCLVEKDVHMCK
ncbi:hypothetical protein BsWGS_18483 [Bradybaena similaris]